MFLGGLACKKSATWETRINEDLGGVKESVKG